MFSTHLPRFLSVTLLVALVCGGTPALVYSQSAGKAAVMALVNGARLSSGLTPLAVNPALETAAQKHSDDMAHKGFVDHTGSDGSTPVERISLAGYPAWSSTRIWGELVYAGEKSFDEALHSILQDEAQRRTLLTNRFREIGIGIATATNSAGVQTTYWTLDFGSQPNVLPIFINDGVTLINVPQVALHLTQEDAMPGGEGNAMGRAVEMRVATDYTFKGINWRKWEALVPFTFDTTPGLKTVYVQMRDGGGRSAISAASVQYDPNSTPQVAPMSPGLQITGATTTEATSSAPPTAFTTPVALTQSPSVNKAQRVPVAQVTAALPMATPTRAAATVPVRPKPMQGTLLAERPDITLPDWLPVYLLVQSVIVLAGAVWFFRMKR